MRDFRDLAVWQKPHQLVLDIYRATRTFPTEERCGLTGQLRRSAASVPTNIAEGCGRDGERERFLSIAAGSASETEYHLLLALDLEYLPGATHEDLHARIDEVKKMLGAFHRSLTANG
jgi:four helix bundle protein